MHKKIIQEYQMAVARIVYELYILSFSNWENDLFTELALKAFSCRSTISWANGEIEIEWKIVCSDNWASYHLFADPRF